MKSSTATLPEPTPSILGEESMTRYYDQVTKQKIDKHLTDINDTITEEDIRNINTNITLGMINKASTE